MSKLRSETLDKLIMTEEESSESLLVDYGIGTKDVNQKILNEEDKNLIKKTDSNISAQYDAEFENEEEFQDRVKIDNRLSESLENGKFTIQNALEGNTNYSAIEPHVKYSLLIISEKIFGDYRVIAFFASIGLLITTYFITAEITKKRIPGILSMLLVLQSNTFLTYDT